MNCNLYSDFLIDVNIILRIISHHLQTPHGRCLMTIITIARGAVVHDDEIPQMHGGKQMTEDSLIVDMYWACRHRIGQ